ncbi:uncharacterized protein LOC117171140 [Belonocnema kinseyi]|uniref:uncharacterized protein LOC117171140 n=1 Tax=Belonocnema kinseyi TaxID=2817044 RepID=UPI00143D7B52|nr:uncharacterized protein LOC117171140 [Belonocnema kinseyi]
MRLMRYNYKVVYVPGKQLILADSLSRNPVDSMTENRDLSEQLDQYVNLIIQALPASKGMLERISDEQESDHVCILLTKYCLNSWPPKNQLTNDLLPYYQLKDNISYIKGFLLYNARLIIPHHFNQRFWPSSTKTISVLVKLATERNNRLIEIVPLNSLTGVEIIAQCKEIFARHGIPETIRSDCASQLSTEFEQFAKDFYFQLKTSSPKYSKSNGQAKSAEKIAKDIIKKCEDISLGLLAYRTTPLENSYSPAELTKLPEYRDRFYVDVSRELNNKCSADNGYARISHNRNGLRTEVFQELSISDAQVESRTKSSNSSLVKDSVSHSSFYHNYEPAESSHDEKSAFPTPPANDKGKFNFCIPTK